MTCIAAIRTDEGVWMAADRRVVRGWDRDEHSQAKMGRVGPALVGCSGDSRQAQVVRHCAEAPPLAADGDVTRWMVVDFTAAIRSALAAAGQVKTDNGVESVGLTMLVAVAGRIYHVGTSLSIVENPDGYAACGGGEDFALGALYATASLGMAPEARLRLALEAAERGNIAVGGPFDFEFLPVSTVSYGKP